MKLLKYREFILEDVAKWKRNWVRDDWDREIGSEYDPYEILEYTTSFHNQDGYDDDNFWERLEQYDKFILKLIRIDDLDLDEWTLDDDKVDEYIEDYKSESGKYPYIVVGEDDGGYTIIDGLHRANALWKMSKKEIKAYVGIEKVNELVSSGRVYNYKKTEVSDQQIRYYFKNNKGTAYTVKFDYERQTISDYAWIRSFRTKENDYDLTGEGDVYNTLNTISRITADFLNEYQVERLEIEHIPEHDENREDRLKENKRARVNKVFLQRYMPDNYDYKLDGYKSIITKKGINESREFDFENDYVWGRLREDGDTLKILDWNTKNKEKGGTIKALQDFRNEYDRIVAIDCGIEGEESFSYWTEMLNRGLIDEFRDDWGGVYESVNITDEEIEKMLDDQQGFNTREDAKEYLDDILNYYNNLGEEITLYRILFIEDGEIDEDKLGDHWTPVKEDILDPDWINRIRDTNDASSSDDIYVIEAKFKTSDIHWEWTIHTNLQFPNEEEIMLDNVKPLEYKIYTLDEFKTK